MHALDREFLAAAAASGRMLNVFGSMSTNTGLAPDVVDRPGRREEGERGRDDLVALARSPAPGAPADSASVPLAQPTAYFVCDSFATAVSSSSTGGAEDEQLRVDDLHHRGNDFIADRRVLGTQIQERDRHCQGRKV